MHAYANMQIDVHMCTQSLFDNTYHANLLLLSRIKADMSGSSHNKENYRLDARQGCCHLVSICICLHPHPP